MLAASNLYPELEVCSAFKFDVVQMAKESQHKVDMRNPHRRQFSSIQRKTSQQCEQSLGSFRYDSEHCKNVILENKYYSKHLVPSEIEPVHKRVYEMARLLSRTPKPPRFRVLDCLGYVNDVTDSCYSFIFEIPTGFQVDVAPVSLQSLLLELPKHLHWGLDSV